MIDLKEELKALVGHPIELSMDYSRGPKIVVEGQLRIEDDVQNSTYVFIPVGMDPARIIFTLKDVDFIGYSTNRTTSAIHIQMT